MECAEMTEQTTLPDTGYISIKTVRRFIEVSKSDWWSGVKSGEYPKAYKIGRGKTRWRAEDIRALIEKIRTAQQ